MSELGDVYRNVRYFNGVAVNYLAEKEIHYSSIRFDYAGSRLGLILNDGEKVASALLSIIRKERLLYGRFMWAQNIHDFCVLADALASCAEDKKGLDEICVEKLMPEVEEIRLMMLEEMMLFSRVFG